MSDNFLDKAVSQELIHAIVELQSIPCLSSFALAGGTKLPELFEMLANKLNTFKGQEFESLFDLDKEQNPIDNIYLLLAFDEIKYNALPSRPNHSHDSIDILSSGKNWPSARAGWRRKVIDLLRIHGLKPPPVKPIN